MFDSSPGLVSNYDSSPQRGPIAMSAQQSTFEIPPFPAFPSVSRYVATGALEDARQRVSRSIDACEGLSLVIGPPGTGKSLLCGVLSRDFAKSHDVVNLGDTPIENAATFYRHLLHHLNVAFESIPEGDLQLALINRVRDAKATEKGLLLLVDEAQAMSPEVLEAIRMTTNIMLDGRPRVYAAVCGGPKLDETLSLPALEPLTQRVAARCYLHPLNSQETREYICESIRHCNAVPEDTITDEAMAAVHHACSGVPRLINQLLTAAIDVAAEADEDVITDALIDRAWAELQQLPSPMIEEPSLKGNSSSVEFGQLDESASFEYSSELSDEPASYEPSCGESSCDQPSTEPAYMETVGQAECDTPSGDAAYCDELSACETDERVDLACTIDEDKLTICEADEVVEIPPTAPQTVLFGDFDEEEDVELGSGIASAHEAVTPAPLDLESMLHSEIIGIASDASDASRHHEFSDLSIDGAPVEPETNADQNTVLWMDDVESTEPLDDDSDIVIHDDSDMLVIEDDVDVELTDTTARIDTEEQVVSVDFQAMLSRMRHGSSKEAS
tara:strand:- start:165741 stop:167417 length:1677 start_codon:yes stop_codon:yes gene_type:complete